jgi:signal transduction histidine kinase
MLARISLRQKVTALLLALSLGPLAIAGFVTQNRAVESGKAAVGLRHAQQARFAAYSFADLFESVTQDLQALGERLPPSTFDPQLIQARMGSTGSLSDLPAWREIEIFTDLSNRYQSTFLALPDGRVFFTWPHTNVPGGLDLSRQPWFALLSQNRGVVLGEMPPLTTENRPSLIGVDVVREAGHEFGYVGAVVDRARLEAILDVTLSVGAHASGHNDAREQIALVTPEGRYAAHSHRELVGQNVPPELYALRTPGTSEQKLDGGETYVVARAEVGRTGWFVMLLTPREVAYHDIYTLTWMLTVVILLTFVFVLLLADHLTTVLLRPVQELERGSEMIGAGALDYRIELSSHAADELGRLAGAFNEMGENLLRNRRELDAYSRNLEVANQELDAMVYAITHDLKKSLRGIEAFATFLQEDFSHQLDDEGNDLVHSIVGNVNRINQLADDLIGLVEHERERSVSSRFDMGELLREARDRALERYPGEVVIPAGLPEVYADRQRLLLVFVNLVTNGLKFNESRPPRVEIQYEDQGVYWEFRVIDNGIGIDPRYHQQIFELFSRLHHQGQYAGSGTGLNLARRIIEEHRGTLTVESEPGRGSTFIVTLPKDPALLTSPGFTPPGGSRSS